STLETCSSSAGKAAVRMGLSYVRGVGADLAERIASGQPYRDMEDLVRRTGVNSAQAEALATAGAFDSFGLTRRAALWSAGAVAAAGGGPGEAAGEAAPSEAAVTEARPGESEPVWSLTNQARTTDHDGRELRFQARQARLSGLVTGAQA